MADKWQDGHLSYCEHTVGTVVECESFSHSDRSFGTPWTIVHQASLSIEFFRQEQWSELPFPSAGNLSNQRIKPSSPALQKDSLLSEPPGYLLNNESRGSGVWWGLGIGREGSDL